MKKIMGLAVAAILIIALASGGTWAFFSDTESSANNSLSAGVLDLTADGGDAAVTTFSVSGKGPGDSGSGSTTLANAGDMSGELDITFSSITSTGGATGEFGDSVGNLDSVAEIAIYVDVDASGTWTDGDIGLKSDATTYNHPTALDYATIASYGSDSFDAIETMAIGASDDLVIMWQIPTAATNNIQGDSVSFDLTFTLEQAAAD